MIGTGVSIGLTDAKIAALSWKGLISHGFAHGVKKGKISAQQAKGWKTQLESKDLDDLLAAAEFMSRKLDAPHGDLYARWLENVFKDIEPTNKKLEDAVRSLHSAGIPLCTLNYDTLLERVTDLPTLNLTDTAKVAAWMRRESQGILHLHGSWDAPTTCVLGIRDYETTIGNDVRNLIQRSLGSFRRLVFIGCGDTFADPNFSALIRWLRLEMKTAAPVHYALVTDGEVSHRHADPSWEGFIEPLSFGASHDHLSGFLLKHFPADAAAVFRRRNGRTKAASRISRDARLLHDYRAFLLKDCGQMTIEGVRADLDTAQRRFDLEHLFVPLKLLPAPPEIPDTDPMREQKLLAWQEKNNEPLPFGDVFAKNKRTALLALPGGGKSLLLKRLAVAYADPSRRQASSDALPDVELTPVLIRCREWREHIHRPILTLLQSFSEITGQASLVGLSNALIPLFKKGKILLLVDGLDEIHDDALRATFVEHLEAFLADYSLTRLVVTSREAGFNLVAPSLARFCQRWRIAPLAADAIAALCDHWHLLMTGASPEAQAESRAVAELLLRNESLRRLAENPLLLTMLLVVKHGAGRLPPDRVSLYSRAVEVLLDTWNIKGHDPLNPKEAVPQLACVAFELMRAGKQTATEKELLALLEKARDEVPQIRRYAKDTPQEFLRRVELRSSLVVEAGRQVEGNGTVPFYQFRHLTFQEYLAAVAAVEGHYVEYDKGDTVMTPLEAYITADEWKEVIPMAAVLARKQAEPIMGALAAQANLLRKKVENNEGFPGVREWLRHPPKLPTPVARLVQCLVEEAEAAPATLISALQSIAFFARGCISENDWRALSRGPYGEELWHQAWCLYAPMQWPTDTWLRNTCASLGAYRQPDSYLNGHDDPAIEMTRLLRSQSTEEIARGLLTCSGLLWVSDRKETIAAKLPLAEIEPFFFHAHPAVQDAAIWAWSYICSQRDAPPRPAPAILDQLLTLWLGGAFNDLVTTAAYALSRFLGLSRNTWVPVLTPAQIQQIQTLVTRTEKDFHEVNRYHPATACMVAFHNGNIWSDEELAARLIELAVFPNNGSVISTLKQMGQTGQEYLRRLAEKKT